MTYVRTSVPKPAEGGTPVVKDSFVLLVPAEDIVTEPTRELGDVNMSGDLTLAANAESIKIYITPSTLEKTEEQSGDDDCKGWKSGWKGQHPGNALPIRNFKEKHANTAFIALVHHCGDPATTFDYIGTKCNPVKMTTTLNDSKEKTVNDLTFAQEVAGKFGIGRYTGATPDIADEPDTPTQVTGEGA